MEDLIAQTQKQTRIYNRLYQLGKTFNELVKKDELYDMALNFSKDDLNYEKCLIFEYNSENYLFKVVKSIGYDNPMEQNILKIINLLLSGEVIEYLRTTGKPIVHSEENPDLKVSALVKSLFMNEAYFELFGGNTDNPYGLIVVGNSFENKENHTSLENDSMTKLALGNFIMQFSNTLNNIIFYDAWNNEKKILKESIIKRTKELTQQKDTFEAIYKTSKDGIAILDTQTTAFLDANQAYIDMTGYTKQELMKTSCLKLSPEKDKQKSKNGMQEVLEKGFVTNFEKDCITKNGSMITINMSVTLMVGGTKVLVSAKDITKQKELERKLIAQTKKAEESTKLKSEFLANMSHEIRTPMNGIIGMSYLALQTNLNDKQKNYIQKIDNSAKSLLGIINDILDFSKIEAGKLEIEKVEFDLFKVIDSVVGLIEFRAHEKNLELIVSYGSGVGNNFYGDSLRISQILTNLMSNAVKFTDSGEVGILVNKVSTNRFRFVVKDTGIGISKEQQEKLFHSFSQADGSTTRKYGGTGLGLTISKQLVELMGGEIWVESQEGVGSSFIFEIELKDIEYDKKYNLFSGKKVLVVDDNKSWHEILENTLKLFDIEVEHAYSGKEAIVKSYECEGSFDLILMDWNMPELDGIESTKLIQNMCFACTKRGKCGKTLAPSVIMVSSFRQETIVKQAKDVGIDIFLQKPINPSILNDMLSGVFYEDVTNHTSEAVEYINNINIFNDSKILLTEDNTINQEIIQGLLEDSGAIIDIANNGKESVEKFKLNNYDLILMDIQMPIMDGYEATKQIRAINKEIPIIALTANAMKEDIEKTKAIGMNEHLNKPIEVQKLYDTLLKYISTNTIMPLKSTINEIKEKITLPNFINIDTQIGLKHLVGNKKLYLKILNDFYNNYKNLNLENLNPQEYKRVIHTIKGLSANIGAMSLNKISIELEQKKQQEIQDKFLKELNKVITQLEPITQKENQTQKKEITKEKRDELFAKLKEAVQTKRAKVCSPIIEEIDLYQLNGEDKELFVNVKKFVKKYRFKDAIEILEVIL